MLDPAYEKLSEKIAGWSKEIDIQWDHAELSSPMLASDRYEAEISHPNSVQQGDSDKQGDDGDTGSMTEPTDYRHELQLRDEQLRREMDLRQESFRAEQATRDKALDERFSGFFLAQSERDKRLDESVADIRGDISKLGGDIGRIGSLKLSIWGAMFTGLAITLTVIGLGLTSYQAGQADRRPADTSYTASPTQPPK